MTTDQPSGEDRATLLIVVPAATVAFALAFNFGAFGVIFFDRILAVWVMATIVLIASLIGRLPPRSWWGRVILLLPSAWVVLAFLDSPADGERLDESVFVVAIVVTLLTLPFIAWVLISAINPEFLNLSTRNKGAVVAAVVIFAAVGWGFGARNDAFLVCDDFKVSGNDLPANCVEADGP
ncbi:MAG: hypothetical protein WBM90_12235 [Acidimicrobiia bacterium]